MKPVTYYQPLLTGEGYKSLWSKYKPKRPANSKYHKSDLMNYEFTENAWEEFEYWLETDESIVSKIKDLLKDIRRTPFQGIGKPEPLRYDLKGYWSRRITGEHRLVYKVDGKKGVNQKCFIIQCRFHYD